MTGLSFDILTKNQKESGIDDSFPNCAHVLFLIYCRYSTYQLVEKHFKITKHNTRYQGRKKDRIDDCANQRQSLLPFYSPKRFDKIVEKLNAAKPDIVLFTGDLIENYRWETRDCEIISQQLTKINAPKGKFAILGNHDYRSNGQDAVVKYYGRRLRFVKQPKYAGRANKFDWHR